MSLFEVLLSSPWRPLRRFMSLFECFGHILCLLFILRGPCYSVIILVVGID